MNMTLPSSVQFVIDRLETAGYEAYAVGGCVRDAYLGLTPHDWDITTSAMPEETKTVFWDCKTVDTGIQHGTVTVVLDGEPFEVTTYRIDGDYKDNRHPEQVTFTRSLTEDLARRDFTMNALAYAPKAGLQDLYGGCQDIDAALVRCVGEPDRRFREDALRILRGLRFAATLGFALEPATADSIRRNAALIRNVSPERIQTELRKLVLGVNAGPVVETFPDVFRQFLPDFQPPAGLTAHLSCAASDEGLRMALLLEATPAPDALLRQLRCPNALRTAVSALLETASVSLAPDRIALRKALSAYGTHQLSLMLLFRAAHGEDTTTSQQLLQQILNEGDCCTIKQLAVAGTDLKQQGFTGPALGNTLQTLLNLVMEDQLENNREALLTYVKSTIA